MTALHHRLNKTVKKDATEQLFKTQLCYETTWGNLSVFVGQCLCGQCTCHPPGDSRVHGKNCECDDRQCEDISGEVCGGESARTHTHSQTCTHTHTQNLCVRQGLFKLHEQQRELTEHGNKQMASPLFSTTVQAVWSGEEGGLFSGILCSRRKSAVHFSVRDNGSTCRKGLVLQTCCISRSVSLGGP